MHAWGLRLRGVLRALAITHPSVLPSAMRNDVGTPVAIISQLDTLPACPPVNASIAASRLAMHDSGPGWFAKPFLCDFSIHHSTPVYPGALRNLVQLSWPKFYQLIGGRPVNRGDSGAWICNPDPNGMGWCGMIIGDDRLHGYAVYAQTIEQWWQQQGLPLTVT